MGEESDSVTGVVLGVYYESNLPIYRSVKSSIAL